MKREAVKVKVWKLTMDDGRVVRAATIEHGERRPNPNCDGCAAPCCKGLTPVLTSDEFVFKKFKFVLRVAPQYITKFAPDGAGGHLMITVPEVDSLCYYLDPETFRCRAWPNTPKACLAYDCRGDDRPEVSSYVKERRAQGTWRE